MKFKIIMETPFGFVMALKGKEAYQYQKPYTLFVDGKPQWCGKKKIICLFTLKPGNRYQIKIQGLDKTISFIYETPSAGYVIDIREYVGLREETGDDTSAINAAIYSAPVGSVVRFSKGVYRVSCIYLKSGVDLFLEEGAVLCQLSAREKLPVIKGYQKNYDHTKAIANMSWEGNPLDCYVSLLYGRDVENIRIYGNGTLNGSGAEGKWWDEPKTKKTAWRPRNVFLAYCKNICIAGISSENSASWNIHPFYSDQLAFYGLSIKNDTLSPNTDGLNPESCEDVEILGCHFHVGDDCIAIKSGKLHMSRHHYKPSINIRIRDCLMEQGHGGVVIGSEIACGVKDVRVERCLFRGTDRGLRIKTRRGRGDTSIVENIRFKEVVMENVSHCFTINMFYHCDPDGHSDYVRNKQPLPISNETPTVRSIAFSNVTANNIQGSAIFIYGLPENAVQDISIRESFFSFAPNRPVECPDMMDDEVLIPNLGVFIRNAKGVVMEGNHLEGPYIVDW